MWTIQPTMFGVGDSRGYLTKETTDRTGWVKMVLEAC